MGVKRSLWPQILETTAGRCYAQSVSSVPPFDPKDEPSSMPWSSAKEEGRSSGSAKLVGSVIDPSVDNDGLGLTGPGAPLSGKRGPVGGKQAKQAEHPVRARLLERARRAREGLPPDVTPLSPRVGPLMDDSHEDTVRLLEPGGTDEAQASRPDDEVFEAPVPSVVLHAGSSSPLDSNARPVEDTIAHQLPGASAAASGEAADLPKTLQAPGDGGASLGSADLPPIPPPPSAAPPTSAAGLPAPLAPPLGQAAPPGSFAEPGFAVPPPRPLAMTPPPGAVATELDQFARRSVRTDTAPRLSPNMTATLGGLLGLTVVVSLGVFLSSTSSAPSEPPLEKAPTEQLPPAPTPEVIKPARTKMPGPWRIRDDATKAGHKVLSGKIGKLAFLTAIQEAGLPKSEAYRAYGALKTELDLDHCSSKDTFLALVSGRDKHLVAFEYIKSKEEVYQVKANSQGRLEAKPLDLQVARNQVRRAFVHDGKSFEESARAGGFDPGLTSIAEDALRGHSTLADFKRGDAIKIIAQEVTVLGDFSRYAGIEALEIARKGEETRRVYYFPHPVEGGYFDKNGRAPYEGGWRKPITDAPRTSKFNPKRMHPVLKRVLPHNGTDFGAPAGTPIGATAPGTITFIGMAGRSGNLVKVKHAGGYESGYAHMSRFAENLKVGDTVDRMQLVGYCGNTGSSTAPHLHFSMKKDGVFIDPESLNLDGLRVLPKEFRPEFELIRQKYDPILDQIPPPAPLAANVDPAEATGAGVDVDPDAQLEGEAEEVDAVELDDMSEDTVLPDSAGTAQSTSSPAAQPTAASPAATVEKGAPAKAVQPSAIFLSDAELLKMQSLTDDGEVRE